MHQNQNVARTRLYEYLPAIYREEGSDAQSNHLCEFLEGLEKVLLGFEEPDHSAGKGKPPHPHAGAVEGLGKEIERLYTLFAPLGDPDKKIGQADKRTPDDFLPWLASWAALALHSGMDLDRQRELIAQIIPLYRKRGTKSYMEDLLTLCVDCDTSVHEEEIPAMQIGVHSTVGEDMHIAGGPPHFFRVVLTAPKLKAEEV
jgi:phage tail-like protein